MRDAIIELHVVYQNPKDHPGKWVVRRFEADVPKELVGVADSLEEVRKLIPERFYNIGRMPKDDDVIYEVWI